MAWPSALEDPLLAVVILLGGGLASIAVSARTGLNFLLVLIATGAGLGALGLGELAAGPSVHLLAELGVAFLLFDIGLHLSGRSLWAARRYLAAFAPLQIALCALALGLAIAVWPGAGAAGGWLAATLALSSTAVVMQLLRESGEEQTPLGRAALAALLAQDLFVVLLLVVLPTLAAGGAALAPLAAALARLAAALVACLAIGRLALAPALAWIARHGRAEAFTAAALFAVLSIAWLTHALGLSIALGAFLAGLALAESRYAHLVQAEVAPFRDLLLALFFLSVGMSIPLGAVLASAGTVVGIALGMIALKAAATLAAARAAGLGAGAALRLGLALAQGSEFAFVVLGVAAAHGLLAAELRAPLEAAIVLSIALTPPLAALGRRLAARIDAGAIACPERLPPRRVVLIGFDATMEALARGLDRAGVGSVAFTPDRERAADARLRGFDVHYGDRERPKGLALAASGGAAAVVIGVEDDALGPQLVEQAAALGGGFPIYAVTGDPTNVDRMARAGAARVVLRGEDAAPELVAVLLERADLPRRAVAEGVAECGERRVEAGGLVSIAS